jgi:hypothetical protein
MLQNNTEIDIYSVRGRLVIVQVWPENDAYEVYVMLSLDNSIGRGCGPGRYFAQPKGEHRD